MNLAGEGRQGKDLIKPLLPLSIHSSPGSIALNLHMNAQRPLVHSRERPLSPVSLLFLLPFHQSLIFQPLN